MADVGYPVLFWRDQRSRIDDISFEQLLRNAQRANQVLRFNPGETKTIQVSSMTYQGDENTVEEPEISGSGEKSIHKQAVGALPEGITITGNADLTETDFITKLRSFSRRLQTDDYHEFGIFGFHSQLSPFFDIDPDNTIGYTMKPPTIVWNAPSKQVTFMIDLLIGGINLS